MWGGQRVVIAWSSPWERDMGDDQATDAASGRCASAGSETYPLNVGARQYLVVGGIGWAKNGRLSGVRRRVAVAR
jgi:hypothetical protein